MSRWSPVLVLAEACAAPPPSALLDPAALTPVDSAHDPLRAHRPADGVNCPPAAWGPEGSGFEVQTGVCDYAAFDQPLPVDLRAGDSLAISVWHDLLDAAEPGTGHVAVWLGDVVLWQTTVQIPAASGVVEGWVALDAAPSPDARLGVHLHNHGFNSWRFVAIDLHPRGAR